LLQYIYRTVIARSCGRCVQGCWPHRAHGSFESAEAARATIAAWREEYNQRRPHQALDMATPADRFRAAPRSVLPLWLPGELTRSLQRQSINGV
jgi:transposase InsO family protein